jgi:hypothetical protein
MIVIIGMLCTICARISAETLWQIGKEDHQYNEFALAGQDVHNYREDPVFVVGSSDPAKDWPFIHPGPVDAWAGKRAHTFSIIFGLGEKAPAGNCVLRVALVDTQATAPPTLSVVINGKQFDEPMPRGTEEGLHDATQGKPYQFEIPFSSDLLQAGPNLIDIVNAQGSWVLYDAITLSAPQGTKLIKLDSFTIGSARTVRALVESNGKYWQPIEMNLRHAGPAVNATISAAGVSVQRLVDTKTVNVELLVPPVKKPKEVAITIAAGGQISTTSVTLKPVRKMMIYVMPHSHHDLGYTALQADVEQKQMNNLRKAMAIAQKTADYPEGARFVWNTEVLWSTDQFLHQAPPADQAALIAAIRKGQIGLNGMYANELTGLCRPEELLQLFRYATQLSAQTGVKIDSAMQSDVPGMTWGLSEAMAQAGVRYFSLAPNHFDRIGTIMVQWQDKPFWWISPSGKHKILVWVPWWGYGLSHVIQHFSDQWVGDYEQRLDDVHFPYDITAIRWAGHGDNGEPDQAICEFIMNWNNEYAWPKFCIASVHDAFSAFEKKYGDKLPEYKGDLTPYWEDGSGSSALETGINRNNGERLVQAEAVDAMRRMQRFPAAAFNEVWRKILLYSEHTWGAWCSVSNSEWAFTKAQWDFKRAFAMDSETESKNLLAEAVNGPPTAAKRESSVDIINTTSWPRSELAIIPAGLSTGRDRVMDQAGHQLASQRLADGDLAVRVDDVPPLATLRLNLSQGDTFAPHVAVGVHGNVLDNGMIRVSVDPATGGISTLTSSHIKNDFAQAGGEPLNDYVYLPGANPADARGADPGKITVIDDGPLVATLQVESAAPGCNKLTRQIQLAAGDDYMRITDTLDKKRVALNPHMGQGQPSGEFAQHGSKESVSFAFPFNVPDGQIRLDIPLASMRPEIDQLPGACKNWLPVGRFADVSNKKEGITLATLDAPLVELGKLSTLLGSQRDPSVWRTHIEPTQKIYSWVMNNHWGTNYRAYQEGIVPFRYALRPHGKYDAAEAARFSTGLTQPLIAAASSEELPAGLSLLRVEPADVLIEDIKCADDGKGWIVRLFGASGKDRQAKLTWASPAPAKTSLSDLAEQPGKPIGSSVDVPGWGLVTLRAEYP